MSTLSDAIHAVLIDLPKAEKRCRYHLRRRDCRLVQQGRDYYAVSRTTGSAEAGPLSIDAMEAWARGGCNG